MACDTFIKIASKCKRHFVAIQSGENEAFIDEIVRNMTKITCDLAPQQVHTFYEACGYMISAQGQKNLQERLIQELMAPANAAVRPFFMCDHMKMCITDFTSGTKSLHMRVQTTPHFKTPRP